MRVLHVNNNYPYFGGTETYLRELANLQKKEGFDVSVAATNASEIKPDVYPVSSLLAKLPKNFPTRSFLEIFDPISFQSQKKIITQFRPDLCHLHNLHGGPSLSSISASSKSNVP
ncbi:MAG: glycosyltransferase, partial [Candidatus Altiarchaeota archaeon]